MILQWLDRQKAKREAAQKQKDTNRMQWCVSRCNALNYVLSSCNGRDIPITWAEEYMEVKTERDYLAQKLGYKIVATKD